MQFRWILERHDWLPSNAEIGIEPDSVRPIILFQNEAGKLIEIMGVYVDDSLSAGDVHFQNETCLTLETFETKPRIYDTF